MNCTNCGGPAQVAPGQTMVNCTFCGTSFSVAPAAPPPPAPSPYGASPYGAPPAWGPPPPVAPRIVVVAPGQSYGTPVAAAAATFVGMRLLFGLLPVVIILIVSGSIYFTTMRATRGMGGGGLGMMGWNGSTPLVCGGNDSYELSGINAGFSSGSVLNVGGNCHVTCRGCNLQAPVVIAAGGNAQIDIIDSHIEGADAVVAGGNAQIRITGSSTVVGKITQGGNASIVAPPGAIPPAATAGAVAPVAPKPKPTVTSGPSPAAPSHGPSKPH